MKKLNWRNKCYILWALIFLVMFFLYKWYVLPVSDYKRKIHQIEKGEVLVDLQNEKLVNLKLSLNFHRGLLKMDESYNDSAFKSESEIIAFLAEKHKIDLRIMPSPVDIEFAPDRIMYMEYQ